MTTSTTDVVVIGGGIFGQVIAKALTAQGRSVTILDARLEGAGSKPAACLIKPSWIFSLGKAVIDPSMELLDDLYGIQDIKFQLRPLKRGGKLGQATVHWIPPSKILQPRLITRAKVTVIDGRLVRYLDLLHNGERIIHADLVVVAAGIWTQMLLPQYPQIGQKGIAFLWRGSDLAPPFIQPWAPYKQLVGFNRGDGYWCSDGTAIKTENWTADREQKSWGRVVKAIDQAGWTPAHALPVTPLLGIRPYAKGHKPCLLEEVRPGLWVASGGAKNGTLAAGYCAHVIRERTV